jgi:hypothetical protein
MSKPFLRAGAICSTVASDGMHKPMPVMRSAELGAGTHRPGLPRSPRPFGTALGPVNRFLTTGFLPPPFREQMQLPWTERDQRQFDLLIELVAAVNRRLPGPVSRFPFNVSLHELRLRMLRNRLIQVGRTVTPRPVREIKIFLPNGAWYPP